MYGIAAFLVLLESVLNGAFLSVGAEGGFVEGAGIALAISLVNVVVPLIFFGPISRYLAHVHPGKRLVAGALTARLRGGHLRAKPRCCPLPGGVRRTRSRRWTAGGRASTGGSIRLGRCPILADLRDWAHVLGDRLLGRPEDG